MRAERSSTIGTERLTNYALQIKSREEFIAQLTSNLPARPEYFLKDAEINRTGASALSEMAPLRAISPVDCKRMLKTESWRSMCEPAKSLPPGHVPGSVNIALSGQFASWAGIVLGVAAHPVLIADNEKSFRRSASPVSARWTRRAEWIFGGRHCRMEASGLPLETTAQMTVGRPEQRGCDRARYKCSMCVASRNGMLLILKKRTGGRWITSGSRRRRSTTTRPSLCIARVAIAA